MVNKLRMEDRLCALNSDPMLPEVCSIVDTSEFPIPTPPTKELRLKFYGRKKRYALKYEYWVRLTDGRILDVRGPFPATVPDVTIYKKGTEKNCLPNERVLGDKGYVGAFSIIHPYKVPHVSKINPTALLPSWKKRFNKYIRQRRVRVERVISRNKRFRILATLWRHPIEKHSQVVSVISRITNEHLIDQPLFKHKQQ